VIEQSSKKVVVKDSAVVNKELEKNGHSVPKKPTDLNAVGPELNTAED